jgi:ATP-dependent RNA helicase RhlE
MPFSSLGLTESLLKELDKQDYKTPYPIQKSAIPAILAKKDILGIAPTGSGKTASYVLPVLTNLQGSTIAKNRYINVLVMVPTRELADQVRQVFQLFSSSLPEKIKTFAVYGGVSINPQMMGLQGVNILVATPGRLLDLLKSKALHLSSLDTLIIDEADKMLNLGFKEEMGRIFKLLPEKRQNLLFSATLSKEVKNIKELLLKDPEIIKIEAEYNEIDLIDQSAYLVAEEKKGPLLRYLIDSNNLKQVLIFTSSVARADRVADKLRKNGFDAQSIHRKKSQGARTDLLTKFKNGKLNVLVATDLISRGIDIQFLPCVINYELPRSPKDYIHRIGRTGRAESPGKAVSLLTTSELKHFKVIQKKMGTYVNVVDSADLKF